MIYVFGDSHRAFFTQSPPGDLNPGGKGYRTREYDIFISHGINPGTAHNFYTNNYPTVLDLIQHCTTNDVIIITAGEIDCRMHFPKMYNQTGELHSHVQATVDKFFPVNCDLQNKGYKVIVCGPHPSRSSAYFDSQNYTDYVGDQKLRNKSCELFNELLAAKAAEFNMPFYTPYHDIINPDYTIKSEYFRDPLHLNNVLWSKARKELGKLYDNYNNF